MVVRIAAALGVAVCLAAGMLAESRLASARADDLCASNASVAQQGGTATASFIIRSAPCVVSLRSYMSRVTGDVGIDSTSQTFTTTGPASLSVRLQCGTDNQVDVYLTTVENASTDLLAVATTCNAAPVVTPSPPSVTSTSTTPAVATTGATANAPLVPAQAAAPAAAAAPAEAPAASVATVTVTQPTTTTLPAPTTTITRTVRPVLRCPAGTTRKKGYCLKTVLKIKRVFEGAKPERPKAAKPAKPATGPKMPSKSRRTPGGRGSAPIPYTLSTRR